MPKNFLTLIMLTKWCKQYHMLRFSENTKQSYLPGSWCSSSLCLFAPLSPPLSPPLSVPLSPPLSRDCEMAGIGDTDVVVVAATEMLADATTTGTGVDT